MCLFRKFSKLEYLFEKHFYKNFDEISNFQENKLSLSSFLKIFEELNGGAENSRSLQSINKNQLNWAVPVARGCK